MVREAYRGDFSVSKVSRNGGLDIVVYLPKGSTRPDHALASCDMYAMRCDISKYIDDAQSPRDV
jgi:hypothetical protein